MLLEKYRRLVTVLGIGVLLLILMGASTLTPGRAFFLTDAAQTILYPLQKGVMTVADGVGGFFNFLFEMKDYRRENDRLAGRVAELELQARGAEDYRAENERLRELLALRQTNPALQNTVAARVIGWSPDRWYDFYTIDKGSLDGVKEGGMVATGLGLVGKVQEVGLKWARVQTIVDAASSVGVLVSRTGDVAMVEGDFELETQGRCKMNFINEKAQIVVGDIVETSGLGELFASGIPLGRVLEIRTAGVARYAIIEPMVDFSATRHVLVECE